MVDNKDLGVFLIEHLSKLQGHKIANDNEWEDHPVSDR